MNKIIPKSNYNKQPLKFKTYRSPYQTKINVAMCRSYHIRKGITIAIQSRSKGMQGNNS